MRRGELAKVLRNVLVSVDGLLDSGHLARSVLADRLVCRPMNLLAIWRLEIELESSGYECEKEATHAILGDHL
jgi:hypothetical protein